MKRLTTFITVIIGIWLLAASCSGPRWEDATFSEHRYYKVSLQHLIENGRIAELNYMHPVDIDAATMAGILGDLSYSEKTFVRDEKELPVFQEKEVDRLVTVLSGALGSAGENQRVVFTSFNKGGGLLFEKQRKTEGLMFVDENGRLNIAFSGINVELPNDEKAAASIKQPVINALETRVSRTPLVTSQDHIHPQFQEDGKPYPMWISIDLAAMEKSVKTTFPEAVDTPASDIYREELRSRLQYLKSLFDDGLISEQEYDESRRKLIDTIR